jgi:serine/threonine protein kinase
LSGFVRLCRPFRSGNTSTTPLATIRASPKPKEIAVPPSAVLHEEPSDAPLARAPRALRVGTRLNEFEIGETIREGGVAVVYAATERAHAAPLAIAEYMPARLAQRDGDAHVTPRTSAQAHAFAKGLKAFVNEARALTGCRHLSLVRVVGLWEANGTAYCVMPRYAARPLLDVRRAMNEPPDEAAVRALLNALLGALEAFHRAAGCHGKVTPANILLQEDNRPVLLRGGEAARAIASDELDVRIARSEPCFAPIEQIVEADAPLDPSVDLYALAGVARFWMSGLLPSPAFGAPGAARRETVARTAQRLRLAWPGLRYSAPLVAALDSALSIYPAERPRSVAEMRARLDLAPPSADRSVGAPRIAAAPLNDAVPPARTAFTRQVPMPRRIATWSGAALALLALLLVVVPESRPASQVDRVLDWFGFHRGTAAGYGAAASAPVAGATAPATPSVPADAEAPKPMPTQPTAAVSDEQADAAASARASARAMPSAAPDAEAEMPPTQPAAGAATAAPPPAIAARATKPPASHGPASPREACGARTQFSMYRCMQMQCSQPRWATHGQCERLRTTDSVD